jgi:hypothetical protein
MKDNGIEILVLSHKLGISDCTYIYIILNIIFGAQTADIR